MDITLSSFEELKSTGVSIKDLTKDKNSGFQDYSSAKDTISPLKEIMAKGSFDELSALVIGFDPLKELLTNKDCKKDDSKDDDKNDDNKDCKKDNKCDGNKDCKKDCHKDCKKE